MMGNRGRVRCCKNKVVGGREIRNEGDESEIGN